MDTPRIKKSMTRDEVAYLVELVQSSRIITSKETNAATNKLKEDAWVSLTAAYNAKCGNIPKSKDQLKLKWDNLKKAARKRSQLIRMNNIEACEKPDYIPPNDILDKVANTLGDTCIGFDVPFDGGSTQESEVSVKEELQGQYHYITPVERPDNSLSPDMSQGVKRKYNTDVESSSESNLDAKFVFRNADNGYASQK